MSLKLACLSTDWGRALHAEALLRGVNSTLIDSRSTPQPGATLFCRLPQRDPAPARAMALTHIRNGGRSVQSKADLMCYENRRHQMDFLADWFPPGEVVRTMEWAEEAIHILGLPIVSKANYGSGSATVRALHTKDEALADAKEVLTRGKPFGRWPTQYGECLWQKFLPGNEFALRVTRVSPKYGWVFKVMNRAHDWRASGSGMCVPLSRSELESIHISNALSIAWEVSRLMDSTWNGLDLLFDRQTGMWRVVDVTLAWSLRQGLVGGHWDAPVIRLADRTPHPKALQGKDQWRLLLDFLLGQE
jgi:hypothetical protein